MTEKLEKCKRGGVAASVRAVGGGYVLRLSAGQTLAWSERPGSRWPWSELGGRRVQVTVARDGLAGLYIDGRAACGRLGALAWAELCAMVSDHLPAGLRHLWPCWEEELPEPVLAAVTDGLLADAAEGGVR